MTSLLTRETHSPEETEAVARELAVRIRSGAVVLLKGDIGTGKSVFARGFIHALPGGEGRRVRSPTFVFIQHHPTTPPVLHVDLYRLPQGSDASEFGLEELAGRGEIMLVEWAQHLPEGSFPKACLVSIETMGGDRRRIRIDFRE